MEASQAVCAREMSVIGIFGRVTEKRKVTLMRGKALASISKAEHLLCDFILPIPDKELL